MFKQLAKFKKKEDGNVAMTFSLLLVPVLILVGAAIDYSRLSSVHKKLQDAADAAALNAALAYSSDQDTNLNEIGNQAFDENAYATDKMVILNQNASLTENNSVSYVLNGKLDPIFVQLFGYPKLDFSVESEASLLASKGLEVAIAFDVTSSMTHGTNWQDSLAVIENTLEGMKDFAGEDNFYVSLVPFADGVNIGDANQNWVGGSIPNGWEGCVRPREEIDGPFPWAIDNDTAITQPFTAMLPGEKYENSPYSSSPFPKNCPNTAITGPSNEPDEIIDAARGLTAGGTGRFDQGLAWAWRLLSPNWQGEWGIENYPTSDTNGRKKKIIFLTDGRSEAYSSYMSREQSWGFNNGSIVAFEHVVELCRKVKAADIELYVLQTVGNPHAVSYLQECATSEQHYYTVSDTSDITIAFADILNEFESDLRLVR